MGRYIVWFTVENLVLRRHTSGAVKCDFRWYSRRYTFPNENFKHGYPHSDAFLQFCLELERCKLYKAACHPMKCGVINDVKQFPTVYCRIYCRNFWRYPIRCRVTKASALEFSIWLYQTRLNRKYVLPQFFVIIIFISYGNSHV